MKGVIMYNLSKIDRPFLDLAKKFFNDDEFFYFPTFGINKNMGLSNVLEKENEYQIEISAPGFKKEDIKIELENDILKISSAYEDQKEEKQEGYYRKEFSKSSFERSFTVPKTANKNEISASMEDGILTVTIPKQEEKKTESVKITIK